MDMKLAGAAVMLVLVNVACGGNGGGESLEQAPGDTAPDLSFSVGTDFDESVLPEDFPRQLIPPAYSTGSYVDLAGTSTASFESSTPVDDTVDHYTALLGEPAVGIEGNAGERNAQWQDSGWVVSVVGSPDESIIGITKISG